MLAFKNRLKKQKDFERVFKDGEGFKQGFLYLKVIKNGLQSTRFGFVVSKKFSKKAVDRNKAKRVIREIIKNNLSEIKSGLDVVVVVNSSIKIDPEELNKLIIALFKKIK